MFPKNRWFFHTIDIVWGEKYEFQVIDKEFLSSENELLKAPDKNLFYKPAGSNTCL